MQVKDYSNISVVDQVGYMIKFYKSQKKYKYKYLDEWEVSTNNNNNNSNIYRNTIKSKLQWCKNKNNTNLHTCTNNDTCNY